MYEIRNTLELAMSDPSYIHEYSAKTFENPIRKEVHHRIDKVYFQLWKELGEKPEKYLRRHRTPFGVHHTYINDDAQPQLRKNFAKCGEVKAVEVKQGIFLLDRKPNFHWDMWSFEYADVWVWIE